MRFRKRRDERVKKKATKQKRINGMIKGRLWWFKLVGPCFIVIHLGIMALEALLLSLSNFSFHFLPWKLVLYFIYFIYFYWFIDVFGAKYYVHVGSASLYGAHQVTMCSFNNYKIQLAIDPPQCLLFSLPTFLKTIIFIFFFFLTYSFYLN